MHLAGVQKWISQTNLTLPVNSLTAAFKFFFLWTSENCKNCGRKKPKHHFGHITVLKALWALFHVGANIAVLQRTVQGRKMQHSWKISAEMEDPQLTLSQYAITSSQARAMKCNQRQRNIGDLCLCYTAQSLLLQQNETCTSVCLHHLHWVEIISVRRKGWAAVDCGEGGVVQMFTISLHHSSFLFAKRSEQSIRGTSRVVLLFKLSTMCWEKHKNRNRQSSLLDYCTTTS